MSSDTKDKVETILIMGDVHIPNRIDALPEAIKSVLTNSKIKPNRIICTGNFGTMETYRFFKSLLAKGCEANFHCVKNDFQETSLSFPEKISVKSNGITIGVINGYQIVPYADLTELALHQKLLQCDIMVSGFTHIAGVFQFEGKWFINPGTISGAFSSLKNNPNPSFMILVTHGDNAILHLYQLNPSTGAFDISKIEINK